jgi:cbb3-type cytochrome oxidase subunit 3
MKKLKSSFTLAFAILFISAFSFTSCGGKKEANNEEAETEQAEGGEHPAAADSTEHPAK